MRALILGVTGQDGSYLAEQLLAGGHEVHGMTRRPRVDSPARLHIGDLLDQDSIESVLREVCPDVVFNLAAVTAPGAGWATRQPPMLVDVTGVGVVRLLDAMLSAAPDAHLVHASSSAVLDPYRYGLYGAAKVLAHEAVKGYRGVLRCSNAILHSHTSPRQDGRFLLPRICATIRRIAGGSGEKLTLGDVYARRDWGYAPDYTRALQLIADQDKPGDWVVSTQAQHSVQYATKFALSTVSLRWSACVELDPNAPAVLDELADVDHEHVRDLGWAPSVGFGGLIQQLMEERNG